MARQRSSLVSRKLRRVEVLRSCDKQLACLVGPSRAAGHITGRLDRSPRSRDAVDPPHHIKQDRSTGPRHAWAHEPRHRQVSPPNTEPTSGRPSGQRMHAARCPHLARRCVSATALRQHPRKRAFLAETGRRDPGGVEARPALSRLYARGWTFGGLRR
jgi:hypothetical protein